MLFSVVIPTCNRNDLLSKCLDQLTPALQTTNAEYEVIVSDDSKDNQAQQLINEKYPNVKWVAGPKRGPAANRNNGAKQANGKWIIFFDDDCQPDKDIISEYDKAIKNNSSVLVFEGAIDCKEKIESPLYASPINLEGGFLWSCNFCIQAEVFNQLNGFDENFIYPNLEDNDLHFRIKALGLQIIFVRNAVVFHPPRKIADPAKLSKYHKSWLYYHKKIGDPKTVTDLLKTVFKTRVLYIKNLPFSKDSFIAFKNMNIELIYTAFKYGFNNKG